MGRNDVFFGTFKTIKDSLEWAYDGDDKEYINFISGVIALADELLEMTNKEEKEYGRNRLGQ